MFQRIAIANGKNLHIGESTAPSYRIADHLRRAWTLNIAAERAWDFVVFNEASPIQMDPRSYDDVLFPSITKFASLFPEKTNVSMFTLFAYETGFDYGSGFNGYPAMQRDLIALGDKIAEKCGVGIIPVGDVWMKIHAEMPELYLWKPDKTHPSMLGSYILSATIYAYIYGEKLDISAYRPEHENEGTINRINQIAYEIVQNAK